MIAGTEPRKPVNQLPPTTFDPIPAASAEWVGQVEEYLTGNGWELVGKNHLGLGVWRDPCSAGDHRGVRTHVADLPKAGAKGSFEPLFQMVVPIARWDRTTDEAIAIQRGRDEGRQQEDATPLEIIDQQGKRISQVTLSNHRIAATLEASLKRPIPEKAENLRAELTRLRREVQVLAQQLKGTESTTQVA